MLAVVIILFFGAVSVVTVDSIDVDERWGSSDENFPVAVLEMTQANPVIVGDGQGGAYIFWNDYRSMLDYDVYGQHIDGSGTPLWGENGMMIDDGAGSQMVQCAVKDGSGGVLVIWRDGDDRLYAQRYDPEGSRQWGNNGIKLAPGGGAQEYAAAVPDGEGGMVVAWSDGRGADDDIYAQRVDPDGSLLWGGSGVTLCTETGDQEVTAICSDGEGGAAVVWEDMRVSGTDRDVYAQMVNSTGIVKWDSGGLEITTQTTNYPKPRIAPDGSGGVYIVWEDDRGVDDDIYAQKVSSAGVVEWTAGGEPISLASGGQRDPVVVNGGSDAVLFAWMDNSGPDSDIIVSRFRSDAYEEWTYPACIDDGSQYLPNMLPDGQGSALIS